MTFEQLKNEMENSTNLFDQFVETYAKSDKKIFLFGAGLCGRSYLSVFRRKNIPLEGVIDNYKTSLDGYPVCRFETVLSKYPVEDCVIVISAPGSENEIMKQVLSVFPKEQVFTFAISRYGLGVDNEAVATKRFFLQHCDFLSEFYENLGDDFSKEVFWHAFLGRVTGNKDTFQQIKTGDFYYPPEIITMDDEEVLVELGANNGETLQDFISRCPSFKRVYCFEPDSACLDKLQEISDSYPNRINIIPKIAWDKKCTLRFCDNDGDGSSSVREDDTAGGQLLPASSVDIEIGDAVTFIKMDIEGAELRALHGAEYHIRQFKPKLAISVYHRKEDLVAIPQYLLSICPDYKFYLRHHGNDDTDTVLYAI